MDCQAAWTASQCPPAPFAEALWNRLGFRLGRVCWLSESVGLFGLGADWASGWEEFAGSLSLLDFLVGNRLGFRLGRVCWRREGSEIATSIRQRPTGRATPIGASRNKGGLSFHQNYASLEAVLLLPGLLANGRAVAIKLSMFEVVFITFFVVSLILVVIVMKILLFSYFLLNTLYTNPYLKTVRSSTECGPGKV